MRISGNKMDLNYLVNPDPSNECCPGCGGKLKDINERIVTLWKQNPLNEYTTFCMLELMIDQKRLDVALVVCYNVLLRNPHSVNLAHAYARIYTALQNM